MACSAQGRFDSIGEAGKHDLMPCISTCLGAWATWPYPAKYVVSQGQVLIRGQQGRDYVVMYRAMDFFWSSGHLIHTKKSIKTSKSIHQEIMDRNDFRSISSVVHHRLYQLPSEGVWGCRYRPQEDNGVMGRRSKSRGWTLPAAIPTLVSSDLIRKKCHTCE